MKTKNMINYTNTNNSEVYAIRENQIKTSTFFVDYETMVDFLVDVDPELYNALKSNGSFCGISDILPKEWTVFNGSDGSFNRICTLEYKNAKFRISTTRQDEQEIIFYKENEPVFYTQVPEGVKYELGFVVKDGKITEKHADFIIGEEHRADFDVYFGKYTSTIKAKTTFIITANGILTPGKKNIMYNDVVIGQDPDNWGLPIKIFKTKVNNIPVVFSLFKGSFDNRSNTHIPFFINDKTIYGSVREYTNRNGKGVLNIGREVILEDTEIEKNIYLTGMQKADERNDTTVYKDLVMNIFGYENALDETVALN